MDEHTTREIISQPTDAWAPVTVRSEWEEGIEHVYIGLVTPIDRNRAKWAMKQGREYLIDWLLGEIRRRTEIDRVCGIKAILEDEPPTIRISLRQPGRYIEHLMGGLESFWVEIEKDNSASITIGAELPTYHKISTRAMKGISNGSQD